MTGGGGAGTIAATKILRASGNYRVILGDMDKWAAGLRFADKSYILPAGNDERFIDCVRDIIRKEKVDVFIPLVDEEILKSYQLKDEFPDLNILLPEYEFSKTVLDKWNLIKVLEYCNLPYPKTYLASDSKADLDYPFIIKPRVGRGSRNVMEINKAIQVEAYKTLTCLAYDNILLQEKIKGKEYTVSVVVNKVGDVLAVVPKEVINKRGITITAITRENSEICSLCVDIQRKLKPNGPFNVQLIQRDDGVPVVFEINPRYSTTISLTMDAGVNDIEMLTENLKSPNGLFPFKADLVMTRFHDQLYFEEK